jgi:hypothetical protein
VKKLCTEGCDLVALVFCFFALAFLLKLRSDSPKGRFKAVGAVSLSAKGRHDCCNRVDAGSLESESELSPCESRSELPPDGKTARVSVWGGGGTWSLWR